MTAPDFDPTTGLTPEEAEALRLDAAMRAATVACLDCAVDEFRAHAEDHYAATVRALGQSRLECERVRARPAEPIPMILYCPSCGVQHVDRPEPDSGWTNPPHKSHLCHACGVVWRPASVPTNGVTVHEIEPGEKDTWNGFTVRYEIEALRGAAEQVREQAGAERHRLATALAAEQQARQAAEAIAVAVLVAGKRVRYAHGNASGQSLLDILAQWDEVVRDTKSAADAFTARIRTEATAAEREACCAALCIGCREKWALGRSNPHNDWIHDTPKGERIFCQAAAIRGK
jgi:rubredoxin